MRCSKCGAENPDRAKFCEECASPFTRRCPSCDTENSPTAKFCIECAKPLESAGNRSQQVPDAGSPIKVNAGTADSLEGERKTVTFLFADIKGSMDLIEDLDPEDARAIVDPALKLMMQAVQRYGGYVAQPTGDGIFALFGAPIAHEEHPQRALLAALRMQEELKRYSDRIRAEGRVPIQARVGVNTGEVVLRSIATGAGRTEYAPVGHSTGIAARMQALAPVGSIAATDQVRKLCEGYFTFKTLGPTKVKGVTEPIDVFEVTGFGPVRTRLQLSASRGYTKFVGRKREMETLEHAAELTQAGHGQIVAAMAEPGVGKSRLFFEFNAKGQSDWMVLEAFSVSHGKASAYLPVLDLLHSYFDIKSDDDTRKRGEKVIGRVLALDRSLEDTLPYLFALLGIVEGLDPLAQIDGQVKKRRTLDAIKRILLRESLNQQLIVMFEDLHWIDQQTQEFLNLLADSLANAKILLLVTYRPFEYSHQWGSKTYYTQLRLDPLASESADEMLSALLGDSPDLAPLKKLIVERTEGNPLFIEELVEALFDEGVLVRNGAVKVTRPLSQLKIPPTVQDIITSRIDRLPAAEKELLQTLAVIGMEFTLALAGEVTQKPDDQLDGLLNQLQLAELIYEQPAAGDTGYIFKHALTHDVAYKSLLTERRRLLHERAGQAMEALYHERLDDHFDDLAHHFRSSDNAAKALVYLRLAGEQSARRSAPSQAIVYLRDAFDRIDALPPGDERDRAELAVQFALGSALGAESWGAPERVRAFERVNELAGRIGAGAEVFSARWHLAETYAVQGKVARAGDLAQQCLRLAEAASDRRMLFGGHYVVGEVALWSGNLPEARSRIMRAMEFCDRTADENLLLYYGIDPFVLGCLMLGFAYTPMGRCDQALKLCGDAQARAAELSHLYSQAFSLAVIAQVHQMRREPARAALAARELSTMSHEHGFDEMLGWAEWITGWAMVEQHRGDQGIQTMLEAIKFHESIGGTIATAWRQGVLAEGYAKNSRLDDGQLVLRRAIETADQTGLHFFDAELCRIGGEIALRSDPRDPQAAERKFRDAIAVAKGQEARLWELRGTVSLGRLLRDTNRREEARAILTEIYNWFTEGFDTADLKDAKALLEELNN
jgi:class 3 adenylate cyclase